MGRRGHVVGYNLRPAPPLGQAARWQLAAQDLESVEEVYIVTAGLRGPQNATSFSDVDNCTLCARLRGMTRGPGDATEKSVVVGTNY